MSECREDHLARIEALTGENARLRKSLGSWVGRWLELAMKDTLDDGTPVLQWVLMADPELADRLRAALGVRHE